MPIFFQQDIDDVTKLGVWYIQENEDFFLKSVIPMRQVSHPHKKLQHLAGRYLLRYLFPDFPVELIQIADTRKPFLEDEAYHFSISHCGNYAAAIVSKTRRVGVDIEQVKPTVGKVLHKFVSDKELGIEQAENTEFRIPNFQFLHHLTILWSCKEAVYKWYGLGEVDFKEHIAVQNVKQITESIFEPLVCFQKKESVLLQLHSKSFGDLVLSYVAT